ncbi:DUF2807 domain-containing protein [Maribacter sp.]|nr:DUF2807 domain-containing protein [Maribacter sp.]
MVIVLRSMLEKSLKITIIYGVLLFSMSCAFDIDSKGGEKGNGIIQIENREVIAYFDTVIASEDLHVFVSQGSEFSILVEADENIIHLIKTDISDGKLHLHTDRNIGRATKKLYISLPNIAALISATGSVLQTQNAIKADSLAINAGTGSFLNAEIYADKMSIKSKEGARLRVSGEARNTSIDVSSGSYINAKDLKAIDCSAIARNGGVIEIKVSKSLMANANTGGGIIYLGTPKVDKTKSLSGDVRKY